MAITATRTSDVVAALAAAVGGVVGLRVYFEETDTFRPPGVVIGQPEKNYAATDSPFCATELTFTLAVVVARSNERDSRAQLCDLEDDVVAALAAANQPALFSVEPQTSVPAPITVGGQELPGYIIRVLVRA